MEDDLSTNKQDAIEEIINERKKKGGYILQEYQIGEYNEQTMYVYIGNSGYDKTIYLSVGFYTGDEHIHQNKWDKKINSIVEGLGFNLTSSNRYRYINTKLSFYDESIYKLIDRKSFMQTVEAIGNEVIEVFENIKNCKELWKLLK